MEAFVRVAVVELQPEAELGLVVVEVAQELGVRLADMAAPLLVVDLDSFAVAADPLTRSVIPHAYPCKSISSPLCMAWSACRAMVLTLRSLLFARFIIAFCACCACSGF